MNSENGNDFKWPVQYDTPNIWEAWEIWTREEFGSYTRPSVPSKPVGQLLITKSKIRFANKSTGFNDGYSYFWIEFKSGKKVELTCEEFKEKKFYYDNRRDALTRHSYIVKDAYTAIKAPRYFNRGSYSEYREYISHYYPDDYEGEYCSVYVLWNKDSRPIAQIRAKAVGSKVECDIAYPGDKAYTPLHRSTLWVELEYLVRGKLVIVEQVHPAEFFGSSFPPSERFEKPNPNFYQRNDTWPPRYYGEPFDDTGFRLDSSCLNHGESWRGYGL